MQVAAFHHPTGRSRVALGLTLAAALVALALGCGGSANREQVVLPPGGFAIGELQCHIVSSVPGDTVVQGEIVVVSFRLQDENLRVVGAFLPVSFETMGGIIPNPPDVTDADGRVTVTFLTDPDSLGRAFVRLIQPDYDLRCDITFRLVEAACSLSAQVLDETMSPIPGSGCGSAALAMRRDMERTVVFHVERPDPVSGADEPVGGAFLLVRSSGQLPSAFEVGPTDAAGNVSVRVAEDGDIQPHPNQIGLLTLTAEVLSADSNGDGLEDSLGCSSCAVSFAISNPPCDQDGGTVTVAYFEADDDPRAMDVLRPGEHAVLSLQLTRDGMPLEDEELFVSSGHGTLNGSAQPVLISTDALGQAMVTYMALPGFGGTTADPAMDTVNFEATSSTIDCSLSGQVAVVTCGLELDFAAPPTRGVPVEVEVRVIQVDPDTTDGRRVALSATGGTLTPPTQTSGPLMGASRTITYRPAASASAGSISLTFIDAYPCSSITEQFDIAP